MIIKFILMLGFKTFSLFIILSFYLPSFAQSSGIKISVEDKKTHLPISNKNIEVIFNDTLKLSLRLNEVGTIDKINAVAGVYKISLKVEGYIEERIKGVVIGNGKTAYLVYSLNPLSGLTKKEKRRYGIR